METETETRPAKKQKTGVGQVKYSVKEKLKQNQYGTEGINTSCGHLLFARENKNKNIKKESKSACDWQDGAYFG